jgi:hypothetical protein
MEEIMKLKKLLQIVLLGPIIPNICIPEEDGDGKGDSEKGNENTDGNKDGSNENKGNSKGEKKEQVYKTQEEFDKAFERRLARERKNIEKEFNNKLEKEKMTKEEKAKAEKDEAIKQASESMERANKKLIRAEVISESSKLGIRDADAAYKLMSKDDVEVDEHGKVIGVKAALKKLITEKPYLKKSESGDNQHRRTGDDQSNTNKNLNNKNFDFNQQIRKAAGR